MVLFARRDYMFLSMASFLEINRLNGMNLRAVYASCYMACTLIPLIDTLKMTWTSSDPSSPSALRSSDSLKAEMLKQAAA